MKQIKLESPGNKAEKTADLMNSILEKYANEKDTKTGKIK